MNFGDLGSHANATSRHRNFDISSGEHVLSCNESYSPALHGHPGIAMAVDRNGDTRFLKVLQNCEIHIIREYLSSFYDLTLVRDDEG